MTVSSRIGVKGWCPGALRPMHSGDGLIVRVRPLASAFSLAEWSLLAAAATRYGNGHLDLTRRANVQIRGVTDATLPPLIDELRRADLLDASVAAETVRNIMLSPLAGIDRQEFADMRPVALELARILTTSADVHGLAPKFGFVLDGGGSASMAADRADVRLLAVDNDAIAVGLDALDRTEWLGSVALSRASEVAAQVWRAFLSVASALGAGRIRHLPDEEIEELKRTLAPLFAALPARFPAPRTATHPIGVMEGGSGSSIAGIGVPFGLMSAADLAALAEAARSSGASEMRVSPWRILYVPCRHGAESVAARARALGFAIDGAAAILKFEACSGAPFCTAAQGETRSVARHLAAHVPAAFGAVSVHVSGCAKGCAAPGRSGLTLVADRQGFSIVRGGRAGDTPVGHVTHQALMADPAAIFANIDGPPHV